ncbi:MAG: hypothetical protein QXR48_03595 [Candidatus Woesearchaeota archaeon]
MIYNLQISVILFLLAVGLYLQISKKADASRLNRLFISLGVLVSVLFYTFYYAANYFTGKGITGAVAYSVKYWLSGAGFSEHIDVMLVSGLFILLGTVFSLWVLFKKILQKKAANSFTFISCFS